MNSCSAAGVSSCSVLGNDVVLADSSNHLGELSKRQFIMVDTHPFAVACTARIVAWELRYSGTCSLKMQIWKPASGSNTDEYELVAQNSAEFSKPPAETIGRVVISNVTEQILLTGVGSTVIFGITSTNGNCFIDNDSGQQTIKYLFSTSLSTLTTSVGQTRTLTTTYTKRLPAFRAILQRKSTVLSPLIRLRFVTVSYA